MCVERHNRLITEEKVGYINCTNTTTTNSTKTAKPRITQTAPYDSPRDYSFLMPKISTKIPKRAPLTGAPNRGVVGSNP